MSCRTRRVATFIAILTVVSVWATAAFAQATDADDEREGTEQKPWVESTEPSDSKGPLRQSTISSLVDDAGKAVVNVVVTYRSQGLDAFFHSTPGGGDAQGSGFIVHPSGYTITNYHVVKNAEAITVRMRNGDEYNAEVIGVDPETDIALMQIERDEPFPTLPLGDSKQVSVGDYVVAIGNPLGLNHTVTSGIVSALGRRDLNISGEEYYTNFIQMDVPINPGNSGGPLLNLAGEVVGINAAVNAKGQGIGFAIPINMVKTLLPQLAKYGYVTRSWLGARVQSLTPALARSFGQDKATGVLIAEIVGESPASEGGLESGDIIINYNGTDIESKDHLPWLVSTTPPGRTVDVEVIRNGARETLSIELAAKPDQEEPDIPETEQSRDAQTNRELDVSVENLTESLARQLGAESTEGVVVEEIGDDSPARTAGLRQRDVIAEINGNPVDDTDAFDARMESFESGDIVRYKVIRGGRTVFVAFER